MMIRKKIGEISHTLELRGARRTMQSTVLSCDGMGVLCGRFPNEI